VRRVKVRSDRTHSHTHTHTQPGVGADMALERSSRCSVCRKLRNRSKVMWVLDPNTKSISAATHASAHGP
jgi:hypothetical protein